MEMIGHKGVRAVTMKDGRKEGGPAAHLVNAKRGGNGRGERGESESGGRERGQGTGETEIQFVNKEQQHP